MVIDKTDIQNLLNEWKERMNKDYDRSYKDAVNDCIYDLQELICRSVACMDLDILPDEMVGEPEYVKEYFYSMEADSYLAQMKEYAV